MEICIIGLPKSGKTTIFNALTEGKSEVAAYNPIDLKPNIGVVKVQDPRIAILERMLQPKKTILAEIKYIDIAFSSQKPGKGGRLSGQFLNYLSSTNAILHVVRVFCDESIPHVEGSINPQRDMFLMDLELSLSDLGIIDRKLESFETSLKSAKDREQDILLKEKALLDKIKSGLAKELPIWQQGLSPEETKSLSNYQFLTAKPMIIVANIGEDQLSQKSSIETELRSACHYTSYDAVVLCGKLEMELTQLDKSEVDIFRKELGLEESALERLVKLSYKLLNLISFFTIVSSELKAWTISSGTTALQAAGKIHSDIEKGFIKAEVISFNDFQRYGNIAEAKRQGAVRMEGKDYGIRDGDIVTFLFNV